MFKDLELLVSIETPLLMMYNVNFLKHSISSWRETSFKEYINLRRVLLKSGDVIDVIDFDLTIFTMKMLREFTSML